MGGTSPADGRRAVRARAAPASGTGGVRPASGGGVGERNSSRDGGQGRHRRAVQAESVGAGAARASKVPPHDGRRGRRRGGA
jgi:hypothetical protein